MKKFKRFLRFQNIRMVVYQDHPKDVSRVCFNLIDALHQNKVYKTYQYGQVQPKTITWTQSIQLPYQAQPSLSFQTSCEHEYGYQLQELKGLYHGKIDINADQFFFDKEVPCFHSKSESVPCGKVVFMIKVIEKQVEKENKEEHQVTAPVKINLRVRVQLNYARLNVLPSFKASFYRKKQKNLQLNIMYNNKLIEGKLKNENSEYKWSINQKFDVFNESPDTIFVKILQNEHILLEGSLAIDVLQKGRRFPLHEVMLSTVSHEKIAALELDLRCLSKTQILDLIYSPTQLALKKSQKLVQHNSSIKTRQKLLFSPIQIKKQQRLSQMLRNYTKRSAQLKDQDSKFRQRYLSEVRQQIKGSSIDKHRKSQDKYTTRRYEHLSNYTKSSQLIPNKTMNDHLPKI